MTIGNDLDQAFYNLGQRITRLEKKEIAYPIEDELNDRIDEAKEDMNSGLDDLSWSLESQVEDLRDCISYESDRIGDLEAYKTSEDDVEYIVDRKLDDRFDEAFNYALEDMDLASLLVRVAKLEARLNKPTLGARILRWLREGPSIKEVATGWYAGIRRGS